MMAGPIVVTVCRLVAWRARDLDGLDAPTYDEFVAWARYTVNAAARGDRQARQYCEYCREWIRTRDP